MGGLGLPTPRYRYQARADRIRGRWPGGRRLAVYVAVGVEDYRTGDGEVETLLPGVPAPDVVNAAWRDYGNRVGIYALLDRLTEYGVPPTVLLNTMVYETAPQVSDAIRAARCEIVAHGISNSDSLADFTQPEEERYLAQVAEAIQQHEGARPGGWSTPWLTHTHTTIDSLVATGYRYLLDLRIDDQPVWLAAEQGRLLSIPYALELNDSSTIIGRQASAGEFADMIVDEFEELIRAAEDQPLVMSVVLHSFISGAPFRLRQISRAIEHIANRPSDVWLTQPAQIYNAFTALSNVQR